MTRTDRKAEGNLAVANLLRERLRQLGYQDMTEFWRNSKVPLSHETVRRAFNGEKLLPENVVKIAAYLDFKPEEIRQLLEDLGDEFWIRYIGREALSQKDEMILQVVKKIVSNNDGTKELLRSQLELVAKIAGVSIDSEMEILQKCI